MRAISFATAETGYGLGGPFGTTYPLKTTDGGRSWRIAGPAFSLPVLDAALSVDQIAVAGPNEAYAYGGPQAGSTIDVTTDGGRQWRLSDHDRMKVPNHSIAPPRASAERRLGIATALADRKRISANVARTGSGRGVRDMVSGRVFAC